VGRKGFVAIKEKKERRILVGFMLRGGEEKGRRERSRILAADNEKKDPFLVSSEKERRKKKKRLGLEDVGRETRMDSAPSGGLLLGEKKKGDVVRSLIRKRRLATEPKWVLSAARGGEEGMRVGRLEKKLGLLLFTGLRASQRRPTGIGLG